MSRKALSAVAILAVIGGVAVLPGLLGDEGGNGSGGFDLATVEAREPSGPSALVRFDSCDELLEHVASMGPYAGPDAVASDGAGAARSTAVGLAGAESDAQAAVAPLGSGETGTNVQEVGIDEPDSVKAADGVIYRVSGRALHAIAADPEPRLLGSLDLREVGIHGHELLISGDRALLLGGDRWRQGGPQTTIAELDIGDPAAIAVLRTIEVDGSYVTARQQGASVRAVLTSQPQYPTLRGGAVPEQAPGVDRDLAERSWMPELTVTDAASGRVERRSLIDCERVRRPPESSGPGMLTVLTIDLEAGLPAVDTDTVMMSGNVVYASADALYVATGPWDAIPLAADLVGPGGGPGGGGRERTTIHKFDTSEPDRTTYVASGKVRGHMLSQWSLSEHEGALRVATTTWGVGGGGRQESRLTVLEQDGDRLEQVGLLEGLGVGEQIYAVRYFGEVGFVVTFRQVDPLYALELSDPTDPRALGELKIPGFSSYLHPVGDELLLGVGQEADRRGRTQGVQLSLFDVSDLRDPRRLDQVALGPRTHTPIEHEHRAFTFAPGHGLAVVPLESWDRSRSGPAAAAIRVERRALAEAGRIEHGAGGRYGGARIDRSLLVDDRLFAVSGRTLSAHDPETLDETGRVELPR